MTSMGEMSRLVIWVAVGLAVFFLWRKFAKPTALTHDSSILFTGGIGSGKSLNSVKVAIKSYRRAVRSWWIACRIVDLKRLVTPSKRYVTEYPEKPQFLSNLPVRIGRKRRKPVFCNVLTRDHLTFVTRIPEHSVVLIDETSQFINQYQWDDKEVQGVLNEFFTFFRHYVDGLLVCNAQSLNEVEVHLRRKLNCYYYCFDFQPFFGLFYRCHILKCRVEDASVSMTSEYIDDNAKWHYGLLIGRLYDTRCYRGRYDKVKKPSHVGFGDYLTNRILRFSKSYVSPLDDKPLEKKKEVAKHD